MSTVHGGPGNIIRDGLSLWLDGANPRSYPPPYTSTTWTDLSGNSNNGTLVNGPIYSSSNGGIISLDGTDDIINLTNIPFNTNPFTINLWFRMNGTQSINNSLIGVSSAAASNNFQLSFLDGTSLRFFYKGGNASDAFSLLRTFSSGVWYNVCIVKDSNNDIKSYVNGVQTNSVNYAGDYNFTQIIRMGLNRGETAYYKGDISTVNIYPSTGLSDIQVRQNFNSIRSRFGI